MLPGPPGEYLAAFITVTTATPIYLWRITLLLTIKTASKDNWLEIAAYLDQKLLENAWLAGSVHNCLHDPGWEGSYVLVSRDDGGITGVACVTPDDRGEMSIFLAGDNKEALQGLLATLPHDKTARLRVYDPEVQSFLGMIPDLEPYPCELYYRLQAEDFTPVTGEPVVELGPEDDALFQGCEQNAPQWECCDSENCVFAIMIDGRIAVMVGVGLITPVMPSGRRVAAISGLYTETHHRRKGLGRRLVSHITKQIVTEGNIPMYWTETDNIPSQGLCRSLGYKQNALEMRYVRKAI